MPFSWRAPVDSLGFISFDKFRKAIKGVTRGRVVSPIIRRSPIIRGAAHRALWARSQMHFDTLRAATLLTHSLARGAATYPKKFVNLIEFAMTGRGNIRLLYFEF